MAKISLAMSEPTAIPILAFRALAATGLHRLCSARWGGMGAILALHRVQSVTSPFEFTAARNSITPANLRGIIALLIERDYDFVTMSEAVERIRNFKEGGRKFVALTFDDGFIDTYREALPICAAFGIPMTVYVMTGAIEGKTPMWWLGLDQVMTRCDRLAFRWYGEAMTFPLHDIAEKRRAHRALANWFAGLTPYALQQACDRVGDASGIDFRALTAKFALSEAMIRDLAKSGHVELGAHTENHPVLSRLDAEAAANEIRDSGNRLSDIVAEPIRHFAYPYGSPDAAGPREFRLAKELGFASGVTTRMANVTARDQDRLHALPRLTINGLYQDAPIMDLMLSGLLPRIRETARAVGR